MKLQLMRSDHLSDCARLYAALFNRAPWKGKWTTKTAAKHIQECLQDPNFRGLVGVGTRLLTHLIKNLKAENVRQISLGTGRGTPAEKFLSAPATFAAAPGEKTGFSLTSGMKFPELDYAIHPDRVAVARFRLGATVAALGHPVEGKSALRFAQPFPAQGLVTAWVTLAPRTLELSEEKVVKYFEEIAAPPEIRARWADLKVNHKWKETYTKCTKTFLQIGDTSSDKSWKEPIGLALEIVPLNDPASLKGGEKAAFRLLENGQALSNIALGLITEKSGRRTFQTTDPDGCATFTLNETGRALLQAVHLQWHDNQWQSNFTTLTVRISP